MTLDELISDRFSPKDHLKAKKSALTAAILTIGFASFRITNPELVIFEFSFEIEQVKIVAIGQLTTLILLVFYIIKIIPEYLLLYRAFSLKQIDEKEAATKAGFLEDYMNYQHEDDYTGSPADKFRDVTDKHAHLRRQKNAQLDRVGLWHSFVSTSFLEVFFPVSLSLVAIGKPESLKDVSVYFFADKLGSENIVETILRLLQFN